MINEINIPNYIKDKFNSIKKDRFLEETSKLSILKQKEIIIKEINSMDEYNRMLENNIDNLNQLKLNIDITKYIDNLKILIIEYKKYYRYLCLLECYNIRKEIIGQETNLNKQKS